MTFFLCNPSIQFVGSALRSVPLIQNFYFILGYPSSILTSSEIHLIVLFSSLFSSCSFVQRMAQMSPLRTTGHRPLPRPAFGSSPNLQALVLEAEERLDTSSPNSPATVFYEVTIASIDQPKLLSRLSESLGDLGLNICEAHAFNTKDRFALDVFVVTG